MKAAYAGSFDPPTLGHADMIVRASRLFTDLLVVVATNGAKKGMLSPETRVGLLKGIISQEGLANVEVEAWDGLLADFARSRECGVLVRGIRSGDDLSYERTMASMNRILPAALDTVFLLSRPEYVDLSSSAVRQIVELGRLPRGLVPEPVAKALEMACGPLLQI